MAISDAPITSYSDTTAQRRVITDVIGMIDPTEVPGVILFGLDNDPGRFALQNWPGTKYEWLEDDLADLADALSGSITSVATTITVDDGSIFKKGAIVLVDLEQMWVSSVSTANVLTVTRNYGGTQATHADNAVVEIIGMARLEGADTTDDYKTDVLAPYNYTQILHAGVKATRTAAKLRQWGISNEYEYQVAKKVPELLRLMNKMLYNGQRKAGSATTPRGFGGLDTFITTNTTSLSGAALTQKAIEDMVQDCWDAGGMPSHILCGAWAKRKITDFYESSVRTQRTDTTGGIRIDTVTTEFGDLDVVMDRWCPKTKVYVVQRDYIGFIPFDGFFEEEMAKSGDYVRGEIIGEYGFVCKHDKAHGIISSISTTA